MDWYFAADLTEVYNVLNSLGMEIETFHYLKEAEYGDSVRLYDFDDETFHKAEQLWAQKEGLA